MAGELLAVLVSLGLEKMPCKVSPPAVPLLGTGTGMGTPLVSLSNAFFTLLALQSCCYPLHLCASDTLANRIPIFCVGFSHSKTFLNFFFFLI